MCYLTQGFTPFIPSRFHQRIALFLADGLALPPNLAGESVYFIGGNKPIFGMIFAQQYPVKMVDLAIRLFEMLQVFFHHVQKITGFGPVGAGVENQADDTQFF